VIECGDYTFLEAPFIVQTPNYPNNYPNSLTCTWVIDAGSGNRVFLNVTDLQVEECCDNVEVIHMFHLNIL